MKLKAYNGIENLDEFYSGLQNFDTKTYYNNTPHNVKKSSKAVKKICKNQSSQFLKNTLTQYM